MGPIKDIYDLIWYGGALLIAIGIIWTGYLGVWEWGKKCRQVETERNYWRDAFFEATNLTKYFLPELPEPPRRR
jgi:hypothetical protein